MAVRPVLLYPHPFLKEKAPAAPWDEHRVPAVFEDLRDTLMASPGCVGLAATQIHHAVRALVVDVSASPRAGENHGLLQLFNPVVVEASQWKISREGCLSFPDLLANVKRAQKIRVQALNEKKEAVDFVSLGFEAVALQHEIDHLDGLLFLDRVRSSKDLLERRKTPGGPAQV
ncbi:MAG TPA: peptide deformylase [bacterium]|nr:peptide deformylase [bacterium]